MASLERLIIDGINRSKVRESLKSVSSSTDIDRQLDDMIEIYNLMKTKGYDKLPEGTAEKKSLREIENKLIELNVTGVKSSPIVKNKEIPGEFITTQEKTMLP